MRFVTAIVLTMFVGCAAVGSLVLAQSQPGAAPGTEGFVPASGQPGGAPVEAPPPMPAARVGVSLTYADPSIPPMPHEQVVGIVAYLAADPEMRKRPDYQVPAMMMFGGEMGLGGESGAFGQLTPELSVFVGNVKQRPGGVEVQLVAQGADDKDLLQAAAKRVVEGLAVNKEPRDQRDRRLREIDQKFTNIEDKKQLLSTVAANTAKLGPEILKDRIKAAELERQRLEMDLIAQRVRSDAIAKEIDRIRQQSEAKVQDDAILKQLRDVVRLREDERARVKQLADTGQAPRVELATADEKVLQANIRVTEREDALRQYTSASLLERLNAELASNMINRAEMEVRLELIRRQQPSIDVKDLDEEKLNRLTDEYRALFRNPGTLPPLYYQLEKQQAELRVQKLALLVSEVKAGDVMVTTQPAQ